MTNWNAFFNLITKWIIILGFLFPTRLLNLHLYLHIFFLFRCMVLLSSICVVVIRPKTGFPFQFNRFSSLVYACVCFSFFFSSLVSLYNLTKECTKKSGETRKYADLLLHAQATAFVCKLNLSVALLKCKFRHQWKWLYNIYEEKKNTTHICVGYIRGRIFVHMNSGRYNQVS